MSEKRTFITICIFVFAGMAVVGWIAWNGGFFDWYCGVLGALVLFSIVYTAIYNAKIKDIKTKLGIDEKDQTKYEVMTNDGRVYKNLIFVKVYRGTKSVNGKWNILFIRKTPYRGDFVYKDHVFKYLNIWKITRLDTGKVIDNPDNAR